ncbi:hypothetical protein HD597_000702 [Nonomuraea thailandensis]|uniref:Uncharacterized protein n=1 Tax=Nonomuraea thailandensis TaxID=1188745 RepID=A0A9X2G9T1_9ACTN|nr:IS110 family transposase [Nonomuraea thailandensis]MCP2353682.1 hypothetical protein [Nonomuraea thailandensis]
MNTPVVDAGGARVSSRRLANDEATPVATIGDVLGLAEDVTWAIDLHSSE